MTALLKVQVVTETRGAAADLDKVEKSASRMSDGMARAAVPAGIVGAALLGMAKTAADAAGRVQESGGAVESVFKGQADAVKNYAAAASQSVGLAKSEYQEMASVIGSQLKNMGVPTQELVGQTDQLITKGADLAATFGGSTADAVAALSSLMRGETDPIEKYGVSIKQADIAAQKAKMGLSGLTGEADKNATTTAMLALLNQQTADAQGAFAREADNAAGAQQRARAEAENAAATLGESLLPAQTAASNAMAGAALFIAQNATAFTILAAVVGGLVAVVLGYNAVMASIPAITAIVTAAQWAWNASLLANPITWVVVGIVALIAIIVLLVRNWETVRDVAVKAWDAIVNAARSAASAIRGAVQQFAGVIAGVWSNIVAVGTGVWNTIQNGFTAAFNIVRGAASGFLAPAISAIQGLMGVADRARNLIGGLLNMARGAGNAIAGVFRGSEAEPQPGAWTHRPQPATFATAFTLGSTFIPGRPTRATAAAPVINITVNGALDPRAVAQQVRHVLNRDARVRGAVALNESVLA